MQGLRRFLGFPQVLDMKNCVSEILLNFFLAGSSPLPVGLLDRLGQSTAISQDPRIHLDGKNHTFIKGCSWCMVCRMDPRSIGVEWAIQKIVTSQIKDHCNKAQAILN